MNLYVIFKYGLTITVVLAWLKIALCSKSFFSFISMSVHVALAGVILYLAVVLSFCWRKSVTTLATDVRSSRAIQVTSIDSKAVHFVDIATGETLVVNKDRAIIESSSPDMAYEFDEYKYVGCEWFYIGKSRLTTKVVFK